MNQSDFFGFWFLVEPWKIIKLNVHLYGCNAVCAQIFIGYNAECALYWFLSHVHF